MAEIFIKRRTLPEAWEAAVIECWKHGERIATQYDKPGDPLSRDCAALIVVDEPLEEPRIHKAFPGSYGKLEEYRQEVVLGIHDSWIDPAAGKWSYTYHKRLQRHPGGAELRINQREHALRALCLDGFTRRALQSTWVAEEDCGSKEPPCVQYVVDRIFGNRLVRGVHIRSNDGFKAAFMNGWAFIADQSAMADELSRRMERPITVGAFRWFADSFHIYGSDFPEFEGFLRSVQERTWEQRTIRSDAPSVVEAFESARELIDRGENVI